MCFSRIIRVRFAAMFRFAFSLVITSIPLDYPFSVTGFKVTEAAAFPVPSKPRERGDPSRRSGCPSFGIPHSLPRGAPDSQSAAPHNKIGSPS
jgi:hypothetical protein